MKDKTRIRIFFIVITSLFAGNSLVILSFGILENSSNFGLNYEITYTATYAFDSSPVNELFMVYNEQLDSISNLKIVQASSNYQWNLTAETILSESGSLQLYGNPSLVASSDKLYLVNLFSEDGEVGALFLQRGYSATSWNRSTLFSNATVETKQLILHEIEGKDALRLSWKDDREGSYNIYSMLYNKTTEAWQNETRITTNLSQISTDGQFIVDSDSNAHFAWAEGPVHHEKILYRKMYLNGTLGSIEELTDGANSCRYPSIIIDSNQLVNVFWTNYTVINPGIQYGTINIQTSKELEVGSWTESLEVGPYVPIDRPESGESDGEKQVVTLDTQNRLWLAYEIREEYLYHLGIDLRSRVGSDWNNGERVSLYNNPVISPFIKCDNAGNVHCLWLDMRIGNYEVYYRVRYAGDYWSPEVALNYYPSGDDGAYKFIFWILAAVVAIIIPIVVMNRIRNRREKSLIRNKIKSLDE